jgi:hypothetical protein
MRCKFHQPPKQQGPNKRKPIAPVSKKRLEQLSTYRKVRSAYMKRNKKCEICKCDATEIHHKNSRENERLYDEAYFMSICRKCHRTIHENPKWAREQGYLI